MATRASVRGARALTAAVTAVLVHATALPATAQHQPWVQVDVGSIFLHERIPTEFHGITNKSTADIAVGIAVGIPLTPWLIPDASFHSSIGRDLPYHTVSIGLAARTTDHRRAYAHVALTRVLASQGQTCNGLCDGPNGNDRRWGVELRAGMNLKDPEQFTLGPTIWFQQSVKPTGLLLASYRAIGIGLQVGFN